MKPSQSVNRQAKAQKRRLKVARQKIEDQKKRIQKRIKHVTAARKAPAFTGRNIQYEISDRTQAICYGGLGMCRSKVVGQRCQVPFLLSVTVPLQIPSWPPRSQTPVWERRSQKLQLRGVR